MSRSYEIPKKLVMEAFERVKENRGSAGVDSETIIRFESNLKDNLYKLWNRLSSGSYFPPAVKAVPIPKKSGGERILGVPTVSDRVAQTVVKLILEPIIEPIFHKDSYGYRPNKSAIDAIETVRSRSWKYDWVIEFDIKGLFDNISHELLMKALRKHCQSPWILMYVERWLKAPMQTKEGIAQRTSGTPQGGVISPLLANLFLHYVFDMWLTKHLNSVRFCRYADDGVIHCKSLEQAKYVLQRITDRFRECGLEIHPDKTTIAYCKDVNRQEVYPNIQFTFLGFTFKPRKTADKYGCVYPNFLPAVSKDALKAMKQTIRGWHIQLKSEKELKDLAKIFNPVLRGWHGYYGKFYESAMATIWEHMNGYLIRWIMNKYKIFSKHKTRARHKLGKMAREHKFEFIHWKLGYMPAAG